MKKTLYEIFDEATPKELEQLSENLKASITMDNEMLTLVKNKVYAKTKLAESRKGRIITMKKEIKFSRLHRSILAGAACLAMVFGCFAGYQAIFNQPTVSTIVTLDVNPSIEIKADQEEIVLDVVALNEDAKIIMDDIEFEGTNLETTVNALIDSMIGNGYINKNTNSVLLSVDNKDENVGNAIKDKLSAEISDLITTESIGGTVISQTVSADDEELSALASQYGITVGKAKLIQTIIKINPDEEFSYYAELNISELNKIMNTSVDGNKDNNTYIGEEKALEIALERIGLTMNDLDAKPTIELVTSRGDICYSITLSITKNNSSNKYRIYIDAFTGKTPGEDVTEPNFTIEEAWDFVCEELGNKAKDAKILEQKFNDMESGLPMTYSFYFEVGSNEYYGLVDAMNGVVIRIIEK